MHLWGDDQLETLEASLTQARAGEPKLLVIEGDAGTGKTALLDELVARADDFSVVAADGLQDYQAPLTVLRQWGVELQRTRDGGTPPPFVTAQALRRVIDPLASTRPVLLRLDDLHWADPESVEALTWLLRRMSGDRLLVAVGTRRLPRNRHPGWQRWAAGRHSSLWISLSGLTLVDAITLIQHHRPVVTAEVGRRLWEHTSGNPLYLTALLEEYEDTRLMQMRMLPAPAAFAQVLATRVARLPESSTTLLRAAAVLGAGWLSLLDVAEVARLDDAARAAQALTDAGLAWVESFNGVVSMRLAHALIRSGVYQQTFLTQRRELHGRAAEVVTAESASLEHRMAAAERYDEALAESMQAYASRLYGQRSFRLAAQHQRWASALTAEAQARERRWLESLFYGLMGSDKATVRSEVHKVQRASDETLRALVLGTWAIWERRRREGIALLAPLTTDPLHAGDPTTRYRIEVVLAWGRVGAGHRTALIAEGLDRAHQLGVEDAGLSGVDLVSSGSVDVRRYGAGPVMRGLRLPEEPAEVPLNSSSQLAWRGAMRARMGLIPQAVADLSEAARRIQDGVTDFGAGSFHAFLGYAQWLAGDWDRARLNFRLAYDISAPHTHPMVLALSPLSHIGEGRFGEADLVLEGAQSTVVAAPWFEACQMVLFARILRLHAGGTPGERATFLHSLEGTVVEPRALLCASPLLTLNVGLAALWSRDTALADECIEQLATTSPQAPWMFAMTTWLRGLVAEERRQDSTALALLTSAVAAASPVLPLYRAHLLVDHARLAARLGQEAVALRSRQRAEEAYRWLGAQPYLDQLAATPATPQAPSSRSAPAVALTDREKDVLTLVLGGMSYAQIARELFITQSTVGYHLSNIYAKAGVRSRHRLTELARAEPRRFGFRAALA